MVLGDKPSNEYREVLAIPLQSTSDGGNHNRRCDARDLARSETRVEGVGSAASRHRAGESKYTACPD
jgi:hypothetical protein